jgi:hypothetical protein
VRPVLDRDDPAIVASPRTATQTGRGPFDQAWLRTDIETLVESLHLNSE